VGQAQVHSRPTVNKAVLDSLLEEFATLKQGTAISVNPSHWISIVKTPMASAVAAAAVLAIVVLIGVPRTPHQGARPQPQVRWQSAADLLTVGHLNAAHRRGGLDELDRQYDKAAQKLKPAGENLDGRIRSLRSSKPRKDETWKSCTSTRLQPLPALR
jgi:hypothetical protein